MASVFLSVRIPDLLMAKIDALVAKTKRNKTEVIIEIVERGLQSLEIDSRQSANYASIQQLEVLNQEIDRLKKPLIA
ncbi:MAG: ribbon-helix-helix protein, CopG family [Snowella sp.]|nr:ribbon-helix-helix protein, CopG family [Snowella sp.]